MYVGIKGIRGLHYFGNYAFLVDEHGNLIKLKPFHTKIIQSLLGDTLVDNVVLKIAGELNISKITAKCHLDQTVKIYYKYLYYSVEQIELPMKYVLFTGEENKRFPYELTIALTNLCGQICRHCLSNAVIKNHTEIPYEVLRVFLESMKGRVKHICLTGGEPLLYSFIDSLISDFGEDFSFSMVTSGYGVQKISNNVLRKMKSIHISIHGGTAEQHDDFVQKEGAFSELDKFIDRVQELQINHVAVTQAKSNDIEHLKKITEYCISKRIKVLVIGELSPIGRAAKLPIWNDYNVDVVEKNVQLIADEYKKDIIVLIDDETTKKQGQYSSFFMCGAGTCKWFVNYKGEIFPCMLCQDDIYKLGEIDEQCHLKLVEDEGIFRDAQIR